MICLVVAELKYDDVQSLFAKEDINYEKIKQILSKTFSTASVSEVSFYY